jgi:hypothetical protein
VKQEQSIFDGLKQEISEECNLEVLECNKLICKDYFYIRNGVNVKVASHSLEVTKYSGEMKNMEPLKHTEQKFMPIEEIVRLNRLSDMTLFYLEKLGIKREKNLKNLYRNQQVAGFLCCYSSLYTDKVSNYKEKRYNIKRDMCFLQLDNPPPK